MTPVLLAAALALAVAGWWWWTRHEPEPTRCEFSGCRRLSTTRVRQWHPSGGTTIGLCEGHASRWSRPPYDQQLDGTDLGRLNLDAEQ